MTKAVRIENADTSNHPLRVTVQERNASGEWVDLPSPVQLDFPTAMTTLTIYGNGRRLVIEERPADAPAT